MNELKFDAASRTLFVVIDQDWTVEELRAFKAVFAETVLKHGSPERPIGVLLDARLQAVQSQDVAAQFAGYPASVTAAIHASAIVVGSILQKLQADRTVGSEAVKVCMDLDEARAFLADRISGLAA